MLRDQAYGWLRLGEVAPQLLSEMRAQIVWAARLVTAVGTAHLQPSANGAYLALEWIREQEMLAGERPLQGRAFRAGVRISTFSLVLLDSLGRPFEEMVLGGRTLSDARQWLEATLSEYCDEPPVPLDVRPDGLAHHPVAGGRTFTLNAADACFELARWYTGADIILRELAAVTPDASPVRCWPQRLDMRMRIDVRTSGGRAEQAIVVGMSPGDEFFSEPYWFVKPTLSEVGSLPKLSHGAEWASADGLAAVLRARKLLPGSAAGQRERVVTFLEEAIAVSRDLLAAAAA